MPPLTRRRFLELLAGAALATPDAARAATHGRRAEPLRSGLVAPLVDVQGAAGAQGAATSTVRGAWLGADEAERAAALFGTGVTLATDTNVEQLLRDARPAVLLGGLEEPECAPLAAHAAEAGILFVNVGCTADSLRGAGCGRHVFHVAPSEAMRRDALAAAKRPAGAVESWHGALEAFGAGQLNDRYRARYGAAMDTRAWEAWMAVKIVAEAALRANSAEPAALGAWLRRAETRFDGHKGRALSFRAWDQQLRQPLYVVPSEGGTPVEVPARAAGVRVADQLDRLGTRAAASTCRWAP